MNTFREEFTNRPWPAEEDAQKVLTKFMPLTPQNAPFEAADFHGEFIKDWAKANAKYFGYRQTAKGIIVWMGEDIHKLPTIQISDRADGYSMVHFVLTDEKEYGNLKVGDEVVLQGNYLVCHPEFGLVMKQSIVIK